MEMTKDLFAKVPLFAPKIRRLSFAWLKHESEATPQSASANICAKSTHFEGDWRIQMEGGRHIEHPCHSKESVSLTLINYTSSSSLSLLSFLFLLILLIDTACTIQAPISCKYYFLSCFPLVNATWLVKDSGCVIFFMCATDDASQEDRVLDVYVSVYVCVIYRNHIPSRRKKEIIV